MDLGAGDGRLSPGAEISPGPEEEADVTGLVFPERDFNYLYNRQALPRWQLHRLLPRWHLQRHSRPRADDLEPFWRRLTARNWYLETQELQICLNSAKTILQNYASRRVHASALVPDLAAPDKHRLLLRSPAGPRTLASGPASNSWSPPSYRLSSSE